MDVYRHVKESIPPNVPFKQIRKSLHFFVKILTLGWEVLILLPLPTFSTEASDQNSGILQMRMKNGDTIVHAYELYKIVAKKRT